MTAFRALRVFVAATMLLLSPTLAEAGEMDGWLYREFAHHLRAPPNARPDAQTDLPKAPSRGFKGEIVGIEPNYKAPRAGSWVIPILPYMEQDNLYKPYRPGAPGPHGVALNPSRKSMPATSRTARER